MSSKPKSVSPAANPQPRPRNVGDKQQAFERLVSDLVVRVADANPQTLDSEIESTLGLVGAHLELGLATLLVRDQETGLFHHTHEWYDPRLFDGPSFRGTEVEPPFDWVVARLDEGKEVLMSSVDDLPPDARQERETAKRLDIRSVLWVPIWTGQQLDGYLAFNSIGKERDWTDQIIHRLRLLAGIFGVALTRRRKELELDTQLSFERLVSELSTDLMSAREAELDTVVVEVLQRLAVFFDFERAFLGIHRGDRLCVDHSWFDERLPADQRQYMRELSPDQFWIWRRCLEGHTVPIESVDELPEEAELERQHCQKMGIRSSIFIPGRIGNRVAGAVALDSMSKLKRWPKHEIRRLTIPVDLLFGALERIQAEHRIRELSNFEHLVGDLSALLAAVTHGELDPALDACLERLGSFLGSERVFLFRFTDEKGEHLLCTHLWTAKNISPSSQIFKLDLARDLPWVAEHIRQDGVIKAGPGLADLPEEAQELREQLECDGVTSGLAVPIFCEGEATGMFGLDTLGQPRDYPNEIIERLRLLASVIGSTLRRLDREAAMRDLQSQLEIENISLRSEIQQHADRNRIVGESPVLQRLLREANEVASTESTVLIQGETGTGKELMARFIHRASRRSDSPLIKVDCATLPATLVESELFGRERGAYTGAMTRQMGRFEVADGGTLFLDEIGELPAETQVKLLRVLEEGAFERLGSNKTVTVDVRVIAVTNRDLPAEVAAGRFREDLFYRLNVFPLTVPTLRERPEDIPLLTWSFVQEFAATMGKEIESISPGSLSALQAYDWPGNIRELRNVLERAMILSHDRTLEVGAFGTRSENQRIEPTASLDEAQRQHILRILEQTGWRVRGKAGAAEILQLKPTTLEARMKKLGIQRPS